MNLFALQLYARFFVLQYFVVFSNISRFKKRIPLIVI